MKNLLSLVVIAASIAAVLGLQGCSGGDSDAVNVSKSATQGGTSKPLSTTPMPSSGGGTKSGAAQPTGGGAPVSTQ